MGKLTLRDGCTSCGVPWGVSGAEGQCGSCRRCLGCCALGKPSTCRPRNAAREAKMTGPALVRRRAAQRRYALDGGRDIFTPKAPKG